MYDAIVVGARCAGSPTAMLLARKGYKVLLLDRASFPSDVMSTHYIQPPGISCLKRWGLFDRVVASGCPLIRTIAFESDDAVLRGFPYSPDGIDATLMPRRPILDKILVDATVESGAELRERFSVREILFDDGQAVGLEGRAASGSVVREHARLIIGADGIHSFVARSVNAPEYDVRPAPGCAYYTYWEGVSRGVFEWYPREDSGFIVGGGPTHAGAMCLFVLAPAGAFPAYRADIEGTYMKAIDLIPDLSARVRAGKRLERFIGEGELPSFFRRPYGPGWALVGDGGYHKDPATGQGIADAFRDAQLLADAVDAGFSGRQSLEAALRDYEKRRNEAVMPMYDFTCQLATITPPPPELRMLIAALRDNPVEIANFFGVFGNTVSIPQFLSPENMQRIIGEAQNRTGASAS